MKYEYRFFDLKNVHELAPFLEAREAEQWDIVQLQFMESGGAHLVLARDDEPQPTRPRYRNPAAKVH